MPATAHHRQVDAERAAKIAAEKIATEKTTEPVAKIAEAAGERVGGGAIALADGTVRPLPLNIEEATMRALITINGGEVVPIPDR